MKPTKTLHLGNPEHPIKFLLNFPGIIFKYPYLHVGQSDILKLPEWIQSDNLHLKHGIRKTSSGYLSDGFYLNTVGPSI